MRLYDKTDRTRNITKERPHNLLMTVRPCNGLICEKAGKDQKVYGPVIFATADKYHNEYGRVILASGGFDEDYSH